MKARPVPILFLLLLSLSSGVKADCRTTWEVPKNHFDGVDPLGHVAYWEKIAEIDIGEDMPFPIVIGFESQRDSSSPYLGYGWVMPLLESSIVQTGENSFEIMKPTGYTSGFGRDANNPLTIGGVQGWKGEVGPEMIRVWAPCGWNLSYLRGKLVEIGTPKGKRILLKRDRAGLVEDVTIDGKILLKVVRSFNGVVEHMKIQTKDIGFEMIERPIIDSVKGLNLVIGKKLSLGNISFQNKTNLKMDYSLDEEQRPSLTVEEVNFSRRRIIWNPSTRKIESDGKWKYSIESPNGPGKNVEISRKNGEQYQYWFLDSEKGTETMVLQNGQKMIRKWFVSGKMAGKPRENIFSKNEGQIIESDFYSYGEDALLKRFRSTAKNLSVEYRDGKCVAAVRSEKISYAFHPKNKK